MPAHSEKRFAVLIDAENVSDKYIRFILDEISNEGEVTYKRIYGDWTKPSLAPWKKVLLEYSVIPVQQYSYTQGKNSSDSAMIIDAMDILYSGNVEGFCLCTSDSDFTRLAARLRESGMVVVGMGEKKAPKAFTSACNKFKYLDLLFEASKESSKKAKNEKSKKTSKKSQEENKEEKPIEKPQKPKQEEASQNVEEENHNGEVTSLEEIKRALLAILDEEDDDDGWVSISDLCNKLLKRYSDFDVRNYGFTKFTNFLKSLKGFEMMTVKDSQNSSVKHVFLREYIPDREKNDD